MKNYDFLVAGHICLDLIPDLSFLKNKAGNFFEHILPGKLINIGGCSISTGGAVSNTGFALSKLGAKVAFSTRIGDDYFGEIILAELKKYGTTRGVNILSNSNTSYTIVISPPGIDRIFLHCTGTNDEYSSFDLPLEMMRKSQIFHFGYPPLMRKVVENEGEDLLKIFMMAKECGCITSLDMSLPDPDSFYGKLNWKAILKKVLPYVDIFLPSLEEAFYMFEKEKYFTLKKTIREEEFSFCVSCDEIAKIAKESIDMGVKISILKLGTRGWILISGDINSDSSFKKIFGKDSSKWHRRELWCPAFKVDNFVGATGSGDCSIAGFLRAFSAGLSPEEATKAAVCLGWQNVQGLDALSGIRSWDETLKLITSPDMKIIDPCLDGSRWLYDEKDRIWKK